MAHLPYDATRVTPAERPRHPLEVALVRLEDRRPDEEAPGGGDRFVYRGREYRGTVVDRLGVDPMGEVTLAVARHLARSRVFERVVVVGRAEEAPPSVDLFLTGALVRLRGYVEAEPPPDESERDPDRRLVVAEVMLADLVLAPAPGAPALARFDVGWSFHDERSALPSPPDPWEVAAEALGPALDQLAAAIGRARLDGQIRVGGATLGALPRMGTLTATAVPGLLGAASPAGWRFVHTSTAAAPADWAVEAGPRCEAGRWRARQEHRFFRRLGPYVPTVELWWCPAETAIAWRADAEFPARYLGQDDAGRRWFGRQVGASGWPGAPDAFARAAGLTPPPGRHRFRLGPGADPVVPSPEPAGPDRPPLSPVGVTPRSGALGGDPDRSGPAPPPPP